MKKNEKEGMKLVYSETITDKQGNSFKTETWVGETTWEWTKPPPGFWGLMEWIFIYK
mgnify:CR=1 FL=1